MAFFLKKYNGKTDTTVDGFLSNETTPINMAAKDFLLYEFQEGTSNYDIIVSKYSKIELNEYSSDLSSLSGSIPIKSGTDLYFPKDTATLEQVALFSEGQYIDGSDFAPYFGDFEDLVKDQDYVRSNMSYIRGSGIDINLLSENIQVWIYLKSIDKIINITSFISSLTTIKSESGNFNITMNPVVDIESIIYSGSETVNYFPLNQKEGHTLDFFEKNIQENDVVFIRFEQLERDKDADQDIDDLNLEIQKQNLKPSVDKSNPTAKKERCWDMIGLVDKCFVNYSSMTSDKTINLSGSDFNKLLSRDGSYFLPYKYISGKDVENKFVYGGDTSSSWFKRNVIDGDFQYFFTYELKKINEYIEFIFNHLSNLGITNNNLWDAYSSYVDENGEIKDDRTKIYDVEGSTGLNETLAVNGVWQIVKIAIEDSLKNRYVTGENLINPNGSLYTFVSSICQKPFVEFWGDTHTDTFDFIIRKPPFTKRAISDVLNNNLHIEIEEKDLLGHNLSNETEFYSFFQIEPVGQIIGNEDSLFQAIVPIISLDQYMDVYGNKGLIVQDAYVNRISVEGKDKETKVAPLIEYLIDDLLYMIETHAYLPFTRKGSITINGDRRIKKGTFIVHKATNELYHVDSVSNNFTASNTSINRVTTLNVSRGMKIPFILDGGIYTNTSGEKTDVPFTYFDIVDVEKIKNDINVKNGAGETKTKKNTDINTTVNDSAFDFFLSREYYI